MFDNASKSLKPPGIHFCRLYHAGSRSRLMFLFESMYDCLEKSRKESRVYSMFEGGKEAQGSSDSDMDIISDADYLYSDSDLRLHI